MVKSGKMRVWLINKKLDDEWQLKLAELHFKKEEKDKDQKEEWLEKERERLATGKKKIGYW